MLRSSHCLSGLSQHSGDSNRSVHRVPTDSNDQFGLQKRRLVEGFQSMSLAPQQNPKSSPHKRQLIQVLNSVEFARSRSSSANSNDSKNNRYGKLKQVKRSSESARASQRNRDFEAHMSDIGDSDEE